MVKLSLKENSIHGTPLFPLHVYSKFRRTEYYVGFHWHEELEFIYVEDGIMEVTVNSETVKITKGNFIFINSGDLHQVTGTGSSIHHAIVFLPQLLNFEYPDTCQNTILKPLISGQLQFPSITDLDDEVKEYIKDRLIHIISLKNMEDALSSLSIKINLFQIIEVLLRKQLFLRKQADINGKQEKIKKVITYIENNYDRKISLEELASILNMNKNYFSKYFQTAIGKTPVTYINVFRCEKAAALLKNKDLKILDIALMVGFENFSYFIRKFKEYKRHSPANYRKLFYHSE
ncbi:helix-turn-helix domain-containing protein [Paenibacillus maysiensis]|uniref:helix-turn-helix domain-containing protein n=1 Tax=Paenibacillus maysiensis TaxID=1155954 RepID=UPI00046FED46|nr:AraC family transcriptional regulator [Paenibacillus maysiensis]